MGTNSDDEITGRDGGDAGQEEDQRGLDGGRGHLPVCSGKKRKEGQFRLLMSLPNWQTAAATAIPNTPTTPAVESEQEIRARNERESGIMISNLGTQRRIERTELIEDMADIRDLACLHESLRWSAVEVSLSSLASRVAFCRSDNSTATCRHTSRTSSGIVWSRSGSRQEKSVRM